MSHPPTLAVAIVGVIAIATVAETYHSAQLPKRDTSNNAATAITPAQQLDRALQALRIDSNRDGTTPTM